MMRWRSASLSRGQAAISASVRRQPRQMPAGAWQTPMQGVLAGALGGGVFIGYGQRSGRLHHARGP